MPKFRIHYKLTCEGYLDFDVENEDEARAALVNDYQTLYAESLDDNVEVVEIEVIEKNGEPV